MRVPLWLWHARGYSPRIRRFIVINDEIEAAFNICASICGRDGVISSQEEAAIIDSFKSIYGTEDVDLDALFENFFSSNNHIEVYLAKVVDVGLQKKIIDMSEFCASIDDLDIRENIALERTKLLWGIS